MFQLVDIRRQEPAVDDEFHYVISREQEDEIRESFLKEHLESFSKVSLLLCICVNATCRVAMNAIHASFIYRPLDAFV
jgi:hypothetical protein